MTANILAFTLITFLHDLFTAVWIGGLIAIGITALPAAREVLGKTPQTKKLMDAIQKRQSVLVYISIAGLVVTGLLMSRRSAEFTGLFSFANLYSSGLAIKHILILGMIAIALYRSLVLGRSGGPSGPSQEKLSARLLFANILLGIAVLLVSGFLAALSSVPLPA